MSSPFSLRDSINSYNNDFPQPVGLLFQVDRNSPISHHPDDLELCKRLLKSMLKSSSSSSSLSPLPAITRYFKCQKYKTVVVDQRTLNWQYGIRVQLSGKYLTNPRRPLPGPCRPSSGPFQASAGPWPPFLRAGQQGVSHAHRTHNRRRLTDLPPRA